MKDDEKKEEAEIVAEDYDITDRELDYGYDDWEGK